MITDFRINAKGELEGKVTPPARWEEMYTKDEVIAMLTELQDELKHTNLSGVWKPNYAEGFNDSVATSVKKIQCRIDKLKENKDETNKSNK